MSFLFTLGKGALRRSNDNVCVQEKRVEEAASWELRLQVYTQL